VTTLDLVREMLASRLDARQLDWHERAAREIGAGVEPGRFCALLSQASRSTPRGALNPDERERERAAERLPGWDPERWTTLECHRVALCLSRSDLDQPSCEVALAEAFRFADVGESCALYRALAHLPSPRRFAARAGEGARSNMRVVFEAACCDTPYPVRWFDDTAWRQAVIKALFVEAPLWRVHGLDERLDAELARMALDLADERRSAGRTVNPELWMCLGAHGGARGLAALEHELAAGPPAGRAAACLALARAGERERLAACLESETAADVRATIRAALEGRRDQRAFAGLSPTLGA